MVINDPSGGVVESKKLFMTWLFSEAYSTYSEINIIATSVLQHPSDPNKVIITGKVKYLDHGYPHSSANDKWYIFAGTVDIANLTWTGKVLNYANAESKQMVLIPNTNEVAIVGSSIW